MPKENEGLVDDRIVDNFVFLYDLVTCESPQQRWDLVQHATRDQLLAIVDICANIFHKQFKLTPKEEQRLSVYWDVMGALSRVKSQRGALRTIQKGEGIRKRQLQNGIRQQGYGFLPAVLIPVLIEAAASLAEKFLPDSDDDDEGGEDDA